MRIARNHGSLRTRTPAFLSFDLGSPAGRSASSLWDVAEGIIEVWPARKMTTELPTFVVPFLNI